MVISACNIPGDRNYTLPITTLRRRYFPTTTQDLWEMPEEQRMQHVADAFEAAYARESAADAAYLASSQAVGGNAPADPSGRMTPGAYTIPEERIWRKRHPLVPGLLDTALVRSLFTLYRKPFLAAGALRFLNTSVQFLPAIFVQRLLRCVCCRRSRCVCCWCRYGRCRRCRCWWCRFCVSSSC